MYLFPVVSKDVHSVAVDDSRSGCPTDGYLCPLHREPVVKETRAVERHFLCEGVRACEEKDYTINLITYYNSTCT